MIVRDTQVLWRRSHRYRWAILPLTKELRQVYSADQLAQFGAPQGLTGLITLETFSKLIIEAVGYQQRAQISERENYTQSVTDRTRKRDILAKKKDVSRRFSHWLPSKSILTKTKTMKLWVYFSQVTP